MSSFDSGAVSHLSLSQDTVPRRVPGSLASASYASSGDLETISLPEPKQDLPVALSTTRLLFSHIGATLALFLATTDATIVSTCLPTISRELEATQYACTWVAVAYMLTQTAFQPLYGILADIAGRKSLMYASMVIFVLGSVLCGAAKNILVLIIARGIAGIGGGGIVSCVWVITTDIEPRHRAKWSQSLSLTWSISAIAGPLIGGLFSSNKTVLSWRYAFFLNLPICLLALTICHLALRKVKIGKPVATSWKGAFAGLDAIGLVLFMTGVSSVIIGFSFASSNGWLTPSTIILLILGIFILIVGGLYECHAPSANLFPRKCFNDATTIVILIINFLHNFVFTTGTFYLALYFQYVHQADPLQAGIQLLPYSLGSSLASIPVAWFIVYWQQTRLTTFGLKLVICAGLALAIVGFALMITMGESSTVLQLSLYPLIAGIGIGALFHAPYQIFVRSLAEPELATGTSAFFMVRFTGATAGLSVAGAVFNSHMMSDFPAVAALLQADNTVDLSKLVNLDHALIPVAIRAISSSIQCIWIISTPSLGVALMLAMFIKVVSSSRDSTDSETQTPDSVPQ